MPSGAFAMPAGYRPRPASYGDYGSRGFRRQPSQEPAPVPSYSYEDEDQSAPLGLKVGLRVKHPQFGPGTIVSVEPLDDDTKLVVRFAAVGTKTLRAKYAKLQPAAS